LVYKLAIENIIIKADLYVTIITALPKKFYKKVR